MIRFIEHCTKIALATVACLWIATSCQDDDAWFYEQQGNGQGEGLPTAVKIKVHVGDMDVRTRSIVDEDAANHCNNIWVGIFSMRNDSCISNGVYSEPSSRDEEIDSLNNLSIVVPTETGKARIVAVANVDNEKATTSPSDTVRVSLRSALGNVKTWSQFKKITVHKENAGATDVMTGTLMMSGHYVGTDTEGTDSDGVPIINIQSTTDELAGAIELTRLTSYNKVRIQASPLISMTLKTWKVCNIPTDSYVFEQDGSPGDSIYGVGLQTPYGDSEETYNFELDTTREGDIADKVYGFEFYQYENKRKACDYNLDASTGDYVGISSNGYDDREREYKEVLRDKTDDDFGLTSNRGIYKSLVADESDKASLLNNNASYFVFTAELDYYIHDTEENRANPGNAQPEAYDATEKQIHRTAFATYTVHLGYCEGDDQVAKANDFNCRRNTKYTYNIKIYGANKIVVEAKSDREDQSGAEGSVIDDYGEYVPMDSHYCVYNIALSNEERTNLSYRITAPYNGVTHTFLSADYQPSWEKNQLYNWIKIKPTSDRKTLALYKENPNDTTFMSLQDLLDPVNHPWATWTVATDGSVTQSNIDADKDGKTMHYYTVFVDEYVYHYGDGVSVGAEVCDTLPHTKVYHVEHANGTSTDSTSTSAKDEYLWYTYTNQDDRVVELIDNTARSSDTESDYTFCKYTIAQKSIQTYYNYDAAEEALGVEHTNENYGLNYRWKFLFDDRHNIYDTETERSGHSAYNGRYNVKLYTNKRKDDYGDADLLWSRYVAWTTPDSIGQFKNSISIDNPGTLYPVPKFTDLNGGTGGAGEDPIYGDPTHFVNVSCMNRNRDLNGDGIISNDEIRWYLPSSGQYVQIGIGQSEMPDPLIKPLLISDKEFIGNNGQDSPVKKALYHYTTSDCRYFWSEEMVSLGDLPFQYASSQWAINIRCVRNLGYDPHSEPTKENEISHVFEHDADNHILTMDRLTPISLRDNTSGYIAPHDVATEVSNPPYKLQYAAGYCKNITDKGYVSVDGNGDISFANGSNAGTKTLCWYLSLLHNGVCGQYSEETGQSDYGTWRVPTFREIGIMYLADLMDADIFQVGCSRNHFVQWRTDGSNNEGFGSTTYDYEFLGYNGYFDRLVPAKDIITNYHRTGHLRVRCVRDVE